MTSVRQVIRFLFPQVSQDPVNFETWREQALRLISVVLMVLLVPLFSFHLYGSLQRQEHLKVAFELVVCVGSIAITFVPRLSYGLRAGVALLSWYLLGAELTLALGLVGSGRILLCIAPILVAVLLGRRAALVGWAAAMALLLVSLGAHAAGLPGARGDVATRAGDLNTIITNGLVVVAVSGIAVAASLSLVTRLAGSLRAAEEANAALSVMLRMLPDLVWFKDAAGRYKFASDVFFSFHGRSREEATGRTAAELFPDAHVSGISRGDQLAIETGRRYYNEGPVTRADGQQLWFDTIKTPVYDEGGRLLGILGTSHDITARKQAEEAQARQARYAQALARSAQLLLSRGESQWGRVAEAIEQIRAAVGAGRFFVYAYDPPPGAPPALVADDNDPDAPPYSSERLPWDEVPDEFTSALAERRWFGGPTAGRWPGYPRFQALYDANGIRSTLVVPLYVDNRLWGHTGISDRRVAREWDEPTVQLILTAAEMLAASIASWEDARALIERTAAAEAATRAKSDFLATMSHEIRTPLNAVVGTADLLLGSRLSPDQRAMADLIRGGGEALLEIINNILDFSRAEAGRLELEQQPLDLHACLDESLAMVAGAAAQKQLALVLDRGPDLPQHILGDAMRLRGVLINLLANAVKFTERGSVALVARREGPPPGAEAAALRFEIRDTGIGIPTERLGEIFEPFTQADSSTTRRYGGSGLGLAICRQLVTLMGGRIEARSLPGEGSTFTVRLPLRAAEAAPRAETGTGAGPPPDRALRVLVAEDNSVNQEVTRRMLDALGYGADLVPDGAAAVAAVARRPYDVVLMDVQMPGVDGLEATRRIRAMGGLVRQPRVIALTANALHGDRERYLEAGMDAYLSKPVRLAELQAALSGLAPPPAPEPAPAGLVDWAAHAAQLQNLGGDDAAELVLRLLSEEIGGEIARLAGDVDAADRPAVVRRAHKLRGGCGQLGARALAEACAALERDGGAAPLAELAARAEALRACHAATVAEMVGGR